MPALADEATASAAAASEAAATEVAPHEAELPETTPIGTMAAELPASAGVETENTALPEADAGVLAAESCGPASAQSSAEGTDETALGAEVSLPVAPEAQAPETEIALIEVWRPHRQQHRRFTPWWNLSMAAFWRSFPSPICACPFSMHSPIRSAWDPI